MLVEFYEWWTRQWLSLLPSVFQSTGEFSGVTVEIESIAALYGSAMTVTSVGQQGLILPFDDTGLAELRRIAARGSLRIRLPAGMIMERRIDLPSAVERDIPQVLRYEMDRLTPFAANDVLWDWTLLRHDKLASKLNIRLSLVKLDGVAALLRALEEHGLRPDRLESTAKQRSGILRILWLRKGRERSGRSHPLRRVAYAVCGLLFLTLCGLPFLRQQRAGAAIEEEIDALRPQVALSAKLRRTIEADAESGTVLQRERGTTGDPLAVLAAVTDALPDGTWLTQLSLQQRALHIEGESRAAAQLIGKLAGVSLIRDPAFAAPVTTDSDHHADVFAIGAEVRP